MEPRNGIDSLRFALTNSITIAVLKKVETKIDFEICA